MNFTTNIQILFFIIILLFSTISFAQKSVRFSDVSKNTEELGEKYIDAYFSMDFDLMSVYMHDDFNFLDPTASLVFGWSNPQGIDSSVIFFKTNYSSINTMKPDITRKIFSGQHAVYEMDLKFSLDVSEGTININMPLVTILTVKDNKVIEHRDYGDYNVYLKQYNEQMEALKK